MISSGIQFCFCNTELPWRAVVSKNRQYWDKWPNSLIRLLKVLFQYYNSCTTLTILVQFSCISQNNKMNIPYFVPTIFKPCLTTLKWHGLIILETSEKSAPQVCIIVKNQNIELCSECSKESAQSPNDWWNGVPIFIFKKSKLSHFPLGNSEWTAVKFYRVF